MKENSSLLFKKLSPDQTHIYFSNNLTEDEQNNVLNYEYFYNGGGVAAADFNNDSLIDLYFTGNQVGNRLFLNKGNLQFEDNTETAFASDQNKAAWHTGVTVVDINQDGWQDLYVSVSNNIDHPELRRNKLFINNGLKNGQITFSDKAHEYGLDIDAFTTQAVFFDYDRDGDLDCYILNHNVRDFKKFDVEAIRFMRDSLAGHKLMQNHHGHFEDVSVKAGIKQSPIDFGLGVHVADFNQDGWPDIYVSIDYVEEDFLYINHRDGTFTDEIKNRTNHISYFSMGNDVADINNDLLPDIITTDMLPEDNKRQKLLFGPDKYEAYLDMLRNKIQPSYMRNMLQLNNGDGTFSEIGQLAGISNTDWTWSALAADFDNDGYRDLFFSNGYLRDYTNMDFMKYYANASIQSGTAVMEMVQHMPSTKTPNYIFKNNGDLTFSNKKNEWIAEEPIISNGAVAVDLDRDGDLELITNNLNEPVSVYQNLSSEVRSAQYIQIHLDDKYKYGAKVELFAGDLKEYTDYNPTHGYQSSNMSDVHFGLNHISRIDSVVVIWPDDTYQVEKNLRINQSNTILKKENLAKYAHLDSAPLFSAEPFPYQHLQRTHNDFARQILLPQMCSYIGPRITQGDVNKDGLVDFYIGGGQGQAGQLFIQSKTGSFNLLSQPEFVKDQLCTDTDASFLDIDNDGDLDLFVSSGGYEYLEHDLVLQNRVYLNDGKGRFTRDQESLKDVPFADNVVKTLDLDRDGDQDVIVGGGCIPWKYPLFNPTRLYRNDKGKLIRVENSILDSLGIIQDLVIADINKDGYDDLIAAGDWTGILYLENHKGQFDQIRNLIPNGQGFWNRLCLSDINKDGDPDIIAGNWGLNSQYKASNSEPILMSVADFDGNGSIDPILSYYIQGKNYPGYSRDELVDQLPILKKKYTSYELYSTTTLSDILNEFKNKSVDQRKITTLETTLLINHHGNFEKGTLPIQAQFAPVYSILSQDLNDDHYPDLILAGNQTHARVRTGNMDALFGTVLINDTKNGFEYMPQYRSGLQLKGDVKDMALINRHLIVTVNNGPVKLYKLNKLSK